MTAVNLSSPVSPDYQSFIWWWLHHSDDPGRMASMWASYYDESAVDGSGPASAIGGLILDGGQYHWLRTEWDRTLERRHFPKKFIHMKDFGLNGDLRDYPADLKRVLFTDLAWVINDNKNVSVGSTLSPAEYRNTFAFLPKNQNISIHGTCFLQAAAVQGLWALKQGHKDDIPFMLDDGCPDRAGIDRAHDFFRNDFPGLVGIETTLAGAIAWEDDTKIAALQAADVIAWVVRRDAAGMEFTHGTDPLRAVIENRHLKARFNRDWFPDPESQLRDITAELKRKKEAAAGN
jgi:hypothetical protein